MPDITMCSGVGCCKRVDCYRAMATPETYQSYFFAPPINEDGECGYYWPTDDIKWDKEVFPDNAKPNWNEEKQDENRKETE